MPSRGDSINVWNHYSTDHYEVQPGQMFKVQHGFGNNGSVDTFRETPRSNRTRDEKEKTLNPSQLVARAEHHRGIRFDETGTLLSNRHVRELETQVKFDTSKSRNPLVKRAGRTAA